MIISIEDGGCSGCDDLALRHQHALRAVFKQAMPPTPDGGREALFWCQTCRLSWYQCGRQEASTQVDQACLAILAARLQADVTIPSLLPHALCPACARRVLGGVARIEAGVPNHGYRLWWQRADAPVQSVCCLSASVERSPQEVLSCAWDMPVPDRRLQQTLHWLSTLPDPEDYQIHAFSPEQSAWLAHSAAGTSRAQSCSGFCWKAFCPPREGWITVMLAGTCCPPLPQAERALLVAWRRIATALLFAL
jgi:hypothetical protein